TTFRRACRATATPRAAVMAATEPPTAANAIVVLVGSSAARTAAASTSAPVNPDAATATGQGHLIGPLYDDRRDVGIRASTEAKSGAGGDDSLRRTAYGRRTAPP